MNWQTVPALRLLLPTILGIVCAYTWQHFSSWAIVVLFAALLIYFSKSFLKVSLSNTWLLGIPLSMAIAACMYWRTDNFDERKKTTHFSHYATLDTEHIFLVKIYEIEEKDAHFNIFATVEGINDKATTGNLQIFLRKSDTLTPPQYPHFLIPNYGDVCIFRGKLRDIPTVKNPESFDYKKYLHLKNIHFQIFTNQSEIQLVAKNRGNYFKAFALHCRNHFLHILEKQIADPIEQAVGMALILGYRAAALDEVRPAYIETGAMHILAVSGMHVGLLYGGIIFLWGRVKRWQSPRGKWLPSLLTLLFVWWFVLLTGAGGSIMRAGVMFTLFELGRRLQRHTNSFNILAASLLILLFFNPFLLFDVGLQMSYLAVGGIIFFYPRIYKIFYFKNLIVKYFWEITAMGLAAQLVITPLSLYYFHRFPTYFWLSGLIAIPASTIGLYAGIFLFALHELPMLANIFSFILKYSLWLMNQNIFFAQKLPPLSILQNIWLSGLTVCCLYAILGGLTYSILKKELKYLVWTLLLVFLLSIKYLFHQINTSNIRQLTIYYVPKSSIFEIFDKKKCITFFSENIDEKKAKLTIENYHSKMNINEIQKLNFNQSYLSDNCLYINGFLQFYEKKMVILDNSKKKIVPLTHNSSNKLNRKDNNLNQSANSNQTDLQFHTLQTDFIFLRDNCPLSIADLQTIFQAKCYIFDASNHRKKVAAWLKECQIRNITTHDIATQGAWIYHQP
jgi:competence protein ComEC